MQVSKNFVLEEFIPKEFYNYWKESAIWFIDPKIVTIAQWFHDYLNKGIIINNWHVGGMFNESGLRDFKTSTGAEFSQHKYGRAIDIKCTGMTGDDLRDIVKKNVKDLMAIGLTTIELKTSTWLHCDCRYTNSSQLLYVNP